MHFPSRGKLLELQEIVHFKLKKKLNLIIFLLKKLILNYFLKIDHWDKMCNYFNLLNKLDKFNCILYMEIY
jgi:hypothetical protein